MVSSFLHAVSFSNHYLILIDTDGQFEIIGGLKKDRVDIPSHISPVTVYLSPDDQLQRVDQHELIKQQLLNEYVNFLRSHDFILRCKVSSKKLKNNTELLVSLFHDKIHLGSYKTRTRGDYDEPTMVFLSTDYLLDLSTLPASIVLPFPYYFIATNNLEFRKGLRFPVFYVNQVIADDNGDVVFQCSCQGENNCSIVHKVRDGICDEIHIATPEVKLKLKSYEQFDSDDKWKQTLAKTSSELQAVILHEQSHTGLKKAKTPH